MLRLSVPELGLQVWHQPLAPSPQELNESKERNNKEWRAQMNAALMFDRGLRG
jgi:hypothetical protein